MKKILYAVCFFIYGVYDIYAADSKYPETTKDKIIVTARLNSENGDVIFTYRNISQETFILELGFIDNREGFVTLGLSGFPDKPNNKNNSDDEYEFLRDSFPRGRKVATAERRLKKYRILTLMPGETVGTTFKIWKFPIWKILPHKIKKFGAYRLYAGGAVYIHKSKDSKKRFIDTIYGAAKEYLRLDTIERNAEFGLPPLKPNIYEKMGIKPYFILDLPTLEKLQKIAPPIAENEEQEKKGRMGTYRD